MHEMYKICTIILQTTGYQISKTVQLPGCTPGPFSGSRKALPQLSIKEGTPPGSTGNFSPDSLEEAII